jgi:hypothetical protein
MPLSALCFSARIDWSAVTGSVEAELEATLDRARKLNRLNGVTGALLLSSDSIHCWLEGDTRGLSDTRDCVGRDVRLSAVTEIAAGEINERVFSRCWLYFADLRHGSDAEATRIDVARIAAAGNITDAARIIAPLTERLAPARQTQRAMLV